MLIQFQFVPTYRTSATNQFLLSIVCCYSGQTISRNENLQPVNFRSENTISPFLRFCDVVMFFCVISQKPQQQTTQDSDRYRSQIRDQPCQDYAKRDHRGINEVSSLR